MNFMTGIIERAKKVQKRIVLPEGSEPRTLQAADEVTRQGIAQVILLGNPAEISAEAKNLKIKTLDQIQIIDPQRHENKEKYIDLMLQIRKSKGLTEQQAAKLIENPLYLGTLMIKAGDADGEVAGAKNATGDVLRPAFQYVKTIPGISVVSGVFFMLFQDKNIGHNGVMVFADCAVHPCPNDKELADIAYMTAQTTRTLGGFEPKIAMLSFSTKGSAKHEVVDKVTSALSIVQSMDPDLAIDGELQVDAALVPSVGKAKAPNSDIAGNANVLIFPSLEAGNIGYKLVQRLAGAQAIGPVLQGMAAPINDLSRGCSVDDIVSMIAITSNQAAGLK